MSVANTSVLKSGREYS